MKQRIVRTWRTLGSSLALCVAACQLPGCSAEPGASESPDSADQDIIAGFPANGSKLNAIGSIGTLYWDEWSEAPVYFPYCSGSLIGPQTVLTAKHCLDFFRSDAAVGIKTAFAIGPDGNAPQRLFEVVDIAGAPNDEGGFVGYGHDVGAMFLLDKVTDLTPLQLGSLGKKNVGKDFVQIGYGVRDNSFAAGTRRVGKAELVALKGKIFEILFGSFEAFKSWFETGSPTPEDAPFTTGPVAPGAFLMVARSIVQQRLVAEGAGPVPPPVGAGGSSVTGGSGPTAGGAPPTAEGGAGSEDPDAFLREIYDSVVLNEGYEAVFGGTEGDAQACYGDSGSPIVKADKQGKLVAYGVVSGGVGSSTLVCDFGGVDAIFGPEVMTFLQEAQAWVDPCSGMSTSGVCKGRKAQRCTNPNEGPRRPIEFDCSLIGQVCATQPDGSAGCSDP
jgi:hypothetical protein